MLRYVASFSAACILVFVALLVASRISWLATSGVESAFRWLQPDRMVHLCGYELNAALSRAGYDLERWESRGCASLDDFDHCMLGCMSRDDVLDVSGGCYHECGDAVPEPAAS